MKLAIYICIALFIPAVFFISWGMNHDQKFYENCGAAGGKSVRELDTSKLLCVRKDAFIEIKW